MGPACARVQPARRVAADSTRSQPAARGSVQAGAEARVCYYCTLAERPVDKFVSMQVRPLPSTRVLSIGHSVGVRSRRRASSSLSTDVCSMRTMLRWRNFASRSASRSTRCRLDRESTCSTTRCRLDRESTCRTWLGTSKECAIVVPSLSHSSARACVGPVCVYLHLPYHGDENLLQ